ncbi:MAG: FAD-dependent thymidylate synthase, partial [Thermoleophilaceae bacterium]
MDYPVESFTDSERAALAPHFTNLDRPVFGLVNLPETVKGALFARYSRYQGTLRRLFLDEFSDESGAGAAFDGEEGERPSRARADDLYERIFLGYGDDSVAQLGGAHIAMEWVSNVMTKLLQRGRLAAYLEQSTRYIAYDAPIGEGLGYRYWRHAELGPHYEEAMDSLFDAYADALPRVLAWAE